MYITSSHSSTSSDSENTVKTATTPLILQKPVSAFRLWCLDNEDQFIGKHAAADLLTKMKTYWRHHTTASEKEEYYVRERQMKQKYYAGELSVEIPAQREYMRKEKRENPIVEVFGETGAAAQMGLEQPPAITETTQDPPPTPSSAQFDPSALHTVHYASRTPRTRSTPYPLNPVQNTSYFSSSRNVVKSPVPKEEEPVGFGDADLPIYF